MIKVDFFTPVVFDSFNKPFSLSLLEATDDYFHIHGIRVSVDIQDSIVGPIAPAPSNCLITTLKIISYFTIILPLLALIVKAVLRSQHTFHPPLPVAPPAPISSIEEPLPVVPSASISSTEEALNEGVTITQEIKTTLQTLLPRIRAEKDDPRIEWIAKGENEIFSLTCAPNIVFKLPRNSSRDNLSRFSNMQRAATVCHDHSLDLLVIPKATKFKIADTTFLAEERMPIRPGLSSQEPLYQKLSHLDETIRQLAIFIIHTGFNDVEWRNIPLLDDSPDFMGNRRIALIDLETLDNASMGLFGCSGLNRRGLIRCLPSEQLIDEVIGIAQTHHIPIPRNMDLQQLKQRRLNEIAFDAALEQFHNDHRILENPKKRIEVDIDSLGIADLDQTKTWQKTYVLRDAVSTIIAHINQSIEHASANDPIKYQRKIMFDLFQNIDFWAWYRWGWLGTVLEALKAQGLIFDATLPPEVGTPDNGYVYT